MNSTAFVNKYGPWALIAGGSEGLGAVWARALASRGLNLVLVARRQELLEKTAEEVRRSFEVQVRTLACDLSSPDSASTIRAACDGVNVGLLVYNAAASPVGRFLDKPLEDLRPVVAVNCAVPLELVHGFGRAMRERGHGGIILMASLSGLQGTSMLAAYAASKAFTLVLAEGLWRECRGTGVDVLACVAGATRTPGYLKSRSPGAHRTPGELTPEKVVAQGLRALGRRPFVITGRMNRFSAFVLSRLLPRSLAVAIISRTTEVMFRRSRPPS